MLKPYFFGGGRLPPPLSQGSIAIWMFIKEIQLSIPVRGWSSAPELFFSIQIYLGAGTAILGWGGILVFSRDMNFDLRFVPFSSTDRNNFAVLQWRKTVKCHWSSPSHAKIASHATPACLLRGITNLIQTTQRPLTLFNQSMRSYPQL